MTASSMRQMLRERAREKICTRASAGSTEMRKLRGPLRVRDACSARGGAALGTRWGAGPLTAHRSPKSRLSRTYRRNLRETAAASYRGSTGLRQTLGQGFDSTLQLRLHTPSTGPSVGPTVGVPQAYGRP